MEKAEIQNLAREEIKEGIGKIIREHYSSTVSPVLEYFKTRTEGVQAETDELRSRVTRLERILDNLGRELLQRKP